MFHLDRDGRVQNNALYIERKDNASVGIDKLDALSCDETKSDFPIIYYMSCSAFTFSFPLPNPHPTSPSRADFQNTKGESAAVGRFHRDRLGDYSQQADGGAVALFAYLA